MHLSNKISKVMLIEDDPIMLTLLVHLLELEGYSVAVNAADGSLEQVIWSIEHEHPDLVILDVNLGDYSGFDVLARMKANENIRNTHVLMSSGIEYTQQSRDAGADGFILKPYMPDDFVGYIQHVLGQ